MKRFNGFELWAVADEAEPDLGVVSFIVFFAVLAVVVGFFGLLTIAQQFGAQRSSFGGQDG